jgi:hypothetical protein
VSGATAEALSAQLRLRYVNSGGGAADPFEANVIALAPAVHDGQFRHALKGAAS